MTSTPLIYLVACEPSADQLGARLMAALRAETDGRVRFAGVGGPRMAAAGLTSLFEPRELALLGIFEVVPAWRRVLRRVAQTLADIKAARPDALVTIDSWGFTGRIHERLARAGSPIRRVRYVAPHVWAWRPGRARQLARWIDHVMTLFPFEPPYFTAHGLAATWVGHPVIESGAGQGDAARFRARHQIDAAAPVLAVLPGSRGGEVTRLLPIFRDAALRLAARHAGLVVAIPTVETVAEQVRGAAGAWPLRTIVVGPEEIFDAFAASRAALAASGTVSLELALAGVPHVIGYRVNPLSAIAFRLLTRTRYVNMVNVLLDRPAIPERLQGACTPDALAAALEPLFADAAVRDAQKAAFDAVLRQLAPPGTVPSRLAARTVLRVIAKRE
jgi:lipid-A-disaccharide synthase